MIHHLGLRASNFAASKTFYAAALAPLGIICFYESDDVAEFGHESGEGPSLSLHAGEPTQRAHVAFAARDRDAVIAFHGAALGAGGRDNGEPGPRPRYRAYCGFILDPDGNNIEAVHKEPELYSKAPA